MDGGAHVRDAGAPLALRGQGGCPHFVLRGALIEAEANTQARVG